MKLIRTLALSAGLALLLSACSKEPEEAALVYENTNPLLAHAPADTIYAFANLEPVPTEITDAYSQKFQPMLDAMKGHVDRFLADYATGEYDGDLKARFAKAVLDELGGDLNEKSL